MKLKFNRLWISWLFFRTFRKLTLQKWVKSAKLMQNIYFVFAECEMITIFAK